MREKREHIFSDSPLLMKDHERIAVSMDVDHSILLVWVGTEEAQVVVGQAGVA